MGVALLAVAGVVAAALAWWWGRDPAFHAAGPAPLWAVAAPPLPPAGAPPAPAGSGGGGGRELPEAVQRYLESNMVPPTSGRLTPGQVDLLEPNGRYEGHRPVPDTFGESPPATFLWTTDRYAYSGDEVVHARFELRRGEADAPPARLEAWAQAEGDAGALGDPVRLVFRADAGAWLADLDLARAFPEHHGAIVLGVRYALPEGADQEEAIRVFTTPLARIPARFTGSFRDAVRDGSLVVEVGIDVREAGFYRVDANLYAASGTPVAWAAFKGELGTSDGVVPLEFFGRVLREAGVPGPYQVGQVRGYRFVDARFPDRERLRDLPGRWTTSPFELLAFSDAVWTSAHKEQMVQMLLDDVRAGRSVEVPPLAVPGAPVAPAPATAPPAPPAPAPGER